MSNPLEREEWEIRDCVRFSACDSLKKIVGHVT